VISQHQQARSLLQGATVEGVKHYLAVHQGIDRLTLTLASGEQVVIDAKISFGRPMLDFHVVGAPEQRDWFQAMWTAMEETERDALRYKAKWEGRSLMAIAMDWPTLVPERLRHLVPPPRASDG
jgi:hypothetical protein